MSQNIISVSKDLKYQTSAVVSKEILRKDMGTVTLFAFDADQGLSEHTAPFDALIQIVDGLADVTIDGQLYRLQTGDLVVMPANIPHAVQAVTAFKMILTMIRKPKE